MERKAKDYPTRADGTIITDDGLVRIDDLMKQGKYLVDDSPKDTGTHTREYPSNKGVTNGGVRGGGTDSRAQSVTSVTRFIPSVTSVTLRVTSSSPFCNVRCHGSILALHSLYRVLVLPLPPPQLYNYSY